MTQEDLLNFDKRINATLKGTMSIRASARAIGVKTDDLQYWIDNGVVPLTVYCIIKIPKIAAQNGESCISILEKVA